MTPRLDAYELVTPASVAEALDDLAGHPGARPFAGGTDLMVLLEAGRLAPGRYVSLAGCGELAGVAPIDTGGISIGALTTYSEIRRSTSILAAFPLLAQAAAETGGVATQNRGTIGGNIANASPSADTPPALLVYDAELELRSLSGARRVPYASFHRGYKTMDLAPGEIIARIILPARPASATRHDFYRKVGPRRAQAIAKVCFAGTIAMDGDRVETIRIALGAVAPTVIRARRTEDALRGRPLDAEAIAGAVAVLTTEIAPIDDLRSTARYRGRTAANLLTQFLMR
ncbi:MAG TPA: xanthine dehydrogenase family protein subunit M [Vicinamibacterales bacterium]|jgi:CO/xanthine dehydrogenase FAD-binding subunit